MGFLTGLLGATVKVVLTPLAVLKDASDVVSGEVPTTTKKVADSAVDDTLNALDDLSEGDIL